jgi:hypothetical protein
MEQFKFLVEQASRETIHEPGTQEYERITDRRIIASFLRREDADNFAAMRGISVAHRGYAYTVRETHS